MLAMFGFKVNEDNFMPLIIVLIGFYSLIWTNSILGSYFYHIIVLVTLLMTELIYWLI